MINHLWQSTVFAVAVGVLTLALRKNSAQVRYWLWLSASVKFLVPFAVLMSLGSVLPRPAQTIVATPVVAVRVVEIAEPFSEAPHPPASPRSEVPWLPIVWACGFTGIALIRLRGWARVRAAVRVSRPLNFAGAVEVRSAPGLLEPGVVGIFRPTLLLPQGIGEKLTPAQLDAVLAHETCHVRRRDNLTSAVHMFIEAIFWFHPLVWWIGARLVEERERACDEEVLRLGGDPRNYADAILNVCKLYVESPLRCVAGVTGSDLKKRVHAILTGRVVRELGFARKLTLSAAALAAVAMPVAVGILGAQSAPKFEVASIRLSKDCDAGPAGVAERPSPGRLTKKCMPVTSYIQAAYVWFDKGHQNALRSLPLSGGPAWVNSDLYEINAKAEGNPGQEMMSGPMMQALLEDRFRLKIHRETREVPVYALTLAKNGPKLAPFREGSCAPIDFDTIAPRQPGDQPLCHPGWIQAKGANIAIDAQAMDVDEFSKFLQLMLDRPIIDKTGIAGRFDFRLEFAPDDMTPRFAPGTPGARSLDPIGGGPFLREAMQEQLGLRLESTRGPGSSWSSIT